MKIYPNLASNKMQKLISLLVDLEVTDRQRMSSDGKESLDNVFELLGMPKHADVIKKHEEEE
tara:strand:+ start:5811 stop:5996 length:186 start_codon:yes stop_codon:yes gene_type:complete